MESRTPSMVCGSAFAFREGATLMSATTRLRGHIELNVDDPSDGGAQACYRSNGEAFAGEGWPACFSPILSRASRSPTMP
jgi:hypothetical protein